MAAKIVRMAARRPGLAHWVRAAAFLVALVPLCSVPLLSDSFQLFLPQLKPGQTLLYEVHGRLNRSVKTESRVSSPRGPQQLKGDLSGQLPLSVQNVLAGNPRPTITVQTELLPATT